MENIIITGHRNPDLDSVCSAYAYAVLKNQIDKDYKYIPVRAGHLSDSAKAILESLSITPQKYMPDVFPKVSDVMLLPKRKLEADDPLTELAKMYDDSNPSAVPVYDNGVYLGLLTIDDITLWFMNKLSEEGKVSTAPTIRMLLREEEETLQINDFFEDAKKTLSASKKRGLPVYDGNKFKGYVTRRCFLKSPSYKVIMVDHNEARQSIKGIETATVVEIVDHHRLDASKTNLPIFIDTEPLGSTCTIVYQMYLRNNIVPDEYTAKVLLTGIISDTLILKSPTTTQIDRDAATSLANICDVNIKDFGREMFSHVESLVTRKPGVAILADFKKYTEKGVAIGIGQCEVTTLDDFDIYKKKYLDALEEVREKEALTWATVMITDVIKEHSILLTTGFKAEKTLPYKKLEDRVYDMPNVMSRKKQLLPEMLYSLNGLTV